MHVPPWDSILQSPNNQLIKTVDCVIILILVILRSAVSIYPTNAIELESVGKVSEIDCVLQSGPQDYVAIWPS